MARRNDLQRSIPEISGDQPSSAEALATVMAVAIAKPRDKTSEPTAPAGTIPPNKAVPIETVVTRPPKNIPAIETSLNYAFTALPRLRVQTSEQGDCSRSRRQVFQAPRGYN
jgi:hypothetical protein